MDIVKDNFLVKSQGEYILYGDEKQNIYSNELEDKDIKTNVRQKPSVLANSFRSTQKIKDIAINFQNEFLSDKYNVDSFNQTNQKSLVFEDSLINYIHIDADSVDVEKIYKVVIETIEKTDQHPNDIAVLGLTIQSMRLLDCYYRYMSNERTNSMFETQEVWFKLFLSAKNKEEELKIGADFINARSDDEKMNQLSILLTLLDLIGKYKNKEFTKALRRRLENLKVNHDQFLNWYENSKLFQSSNEDRPISIRDFEKKYKGASKIVRELKSVRDNKKFHFWYNSGTIKLSTIHSFKGWEAETLILVIEPQYDYSDFNTSFDELIYTGLTRSKKNLVIMNFGNNDFDKQLRKVMD